MAAWEAFSINWNSWNHLGICLKTEKPRKPWPNWPVSGPSVCTLTSSQQSGKQKMEIPWPFPNICVVASCSGTIVVDKANLRSDNWILRLTWTTFKDTARTVQQTLSVSVIMLYREIIAVCSQIDTKHVNSLWGQNLEFCNVHSGGTRNNCWTLEG